jgi:hypothetical protein
VWLVLYIALSLLTPFVLLVLGESIPLGRISKVRVVIVSPLLIGLFLVAVQPQLSNVREFNSSDQLKTKWAEVVLEEYRRAPARPVACLNTVQDDVAGDADAQLCTQMSLRLAGFVAPVYEYWGKATGCSTHTEAETPVFTRQMLANLTLILSDPKRTSSMAGCQASSPTSFNGWLTSVEWPFVRKIDVTGIEVFPKPTHVGP